MVSHTTTGEWQSFEGRMRRRRAARLLLRAEIAAEAGCIEDARACLEEARSLAPGLPGIVAAEEALNAPRQAEPVVEAAPARRWWIPVSITAAILGAVIAFATARPPRTLATGSTASSVEVAPPPAVHATDRTTSMTATWPPKEASAQAPSPQEQFSASPLAASEVKQQPDPLPVVDAHDVAREIPAEPPPTPPAASSPAPGSVPNLDDAPAPIGPPSVPASAVLKDALPLEATAVAPLSVAPAPVAPAPVATAPPRPAPEAAVRSVLDRYAAAYNALDAGAAQRVWPGVDRSALARAFDGLASQRLSLGSCRIEVGGDSARAQCSGRATWTPKIGSGARTESRHWTFDLARSASGWDIVSARAQNK